MPSRFNPTELPHFHPTHIVVHYNEVALKGRNRGHFEDRLVDNARLALRDLGKLHVKRLFGRIVVELGEEVSWPAATKRLQRIFGIAYVFPAITAEPNFDSLKAALGRSLAGEYPSRSFAVLCKRATKELPFTSVDAQQELGAHAQELTGWPVKLKNPEVEIRVELVNKAAFVGFGKIPGSGGMPSGVAGKVVCLLSGGIDSPVAAYRLMRRGATPVFVHFHSYPHTSAESQEKVRELAARLLPNGMTARLYEVPFAETQRMIVAQAPDPLRVLLYRRFMLRVAEALARKVHALALVTGESLGQVASQTLENLRSIDAATSLPVLRPLIGMDKLEIVAEAKRIDTFEISIEPHDDCCSFLMPRNPATTSNPKTLDTAETDFDVDAEIRTLLEKTTVVTLGKPAHEGLTVQKEG